MKTLQRLVTVLVVVMALATAGAASNYTIIDLGWGYASGINNSGQIVGGGGHASLWQDGSITDLGTLGGTRSEARGINDSGQIVGWAEMSCGYHASLWQKEVIIDLATLSGVPIEFNMANGINDSGQIVGWSGGAYPSTAHACLWQDGTITDVINYSFF